MKIAVLGPDGAGKTSVIQGLIVKLSDGRRKVKMRHLKPSYVMPRPAGSQAIVTDPHGKPPRSALVSVGKILVWLIEEWYANVFQDRKDELLICDRYYHDLLIDPRRYRYGGPEWAARHVGELMPQPDLWVLLDAPAEVLQARKQEVPLEETLRQRNAYLSFIHGRKHSAIVDAAQSLDKVIADVEHAVLKALVPNLGIHG